MGAGCMRIPDPTFASKSLHHSNLSTPGRAKRKTVHNEPSSKEPQRRRSIFGKKDSYIEAASAELMPNATKSQEDTQKILAALNSHFIFAGLTDEDKEMVAGAMQLYSFTPDSVVFMQGMPSKSYYVIRSGLIEVIVNGKKVNRIREGDGFGELALLHDNPRSATLKCIEPTVLWGLDRETFKKVIEEMNIQIYEQNRAFLEKVSLLDSLTAVQKDNLAASLVSHKYFCGQKIIAEGETGNQLYFIKEGIVSVMKSNQEIRRMYPGSYFGESALINNTPRTATCVAVDGPVKCMCLSRESLQKTLNNKLQDIIEKNTINEAMKKSQKLCVLNKEQKEKIAEAISEKQFKAGDVVIGMGSFCASKMYFVMSGRLQFAKNSVLFADKSTVVGELHVTSSGNSEVKYEDDFIAGSDMKIGEITKYQFENAIGGKYENVVMENAAGNVLRKIYLFSTIDFAKIKNVLSYISIEKFNDSEIILREGVMSMSVHVVKRGKVDVFKAGNLVKSIGKHGYFGERGLVLGEASITTYVANGHATLWTIKVADFINFVNEKMKKQLISKISIEDEDCDIENLVVIKQLGKGTHSRVYLVTTPKKKLYALKVVSRRKIHKYVLYEQLIVRNK